MKTSMFRFCTLLAFGLAASQSILPAQEKSGLEGVWHVSVTVTNCQTGAPIRTVGSLQMFSHDGSLTETANTASRGISVGSWGPAGEQKYDASFWFFRYKPDGTFASIAKATDKITLGPDGTQFTAAGTIQDFDATGALISTGCFTHAANRLTDSERRRDDSE